MGNFTPSFEEVLALQDEQQPDVSVDATEVQLCRARRLATSLVNGAVQTSRDVGRTVVYGAGAGLASEALAGSRPNVTALTITGMVANIAIHTVIPNLKR